MIYDAYDFAAPGIAIAAKAMAGERRKTGVEMMEKIFAALESEKATQAAERRAASSKPPSCYVHAHGYRGRSQRGTCDNPDHDPWPPGASAPRNRAPPPTPEPDEAVDEGETVPVSIGDMVRAAVKAAITPERAPIPRRRVQTAEQREISCANLVKAREARRARVEAQAQALSAEKSRAEKAESLVKGMTEELEQARARAAMQITQPPTPTPTPAPTMQITRELSAPTPAPAPTTQPPAPATPRASSPLAWKRPSHLY